MAIYDKSSSLGQTTAAIFYQAIATKQACDRLAADFAAMETNGGVADGDYAAIATAMGISPANAHELAFLLGNIQTHLNAIVALGNFYKYDPSAN